MKWKEENEEKIFLFSFYFSKPLKLVLGLPKWKFSTGKKISRWEKNQEMTLPPPYAPDWHVLFCY